MIPFFLFLLTYTNFRCKIIIHFDIYINIAALILLGNQLMTYYLLNFNCNNITLYAIRTNSLCFEYLVRFFLFGAPFFIFFSTICSFKVYVDILCGINWLHVIYSSTTSISLFSSFNSYRCMKYTEKSHLSVFLLFSGVR